MPNAIGFKGIIYAAQSQASHIICQRHYLRPSWPGLADYP